MQKYEVAGVSLAVEERGAGPPLLFVHGFPLDHTMWQAQLDALAADWRVIAPDLRGFGASGGTHGTVTMLQFAQDLAGLLGALDVGEPVVLCGLSMGGYVAFEFWKHHANRLRGLVLCDTRAAPDTPEGATGRYQLAEAVLADGAGVASGAMLEKLVAPVTRRTRPELVAELQQMIERAQPESIAAALRGMAERLDARPWLSEIRVPTLVVVGEHDAITTVDEMRSVASAIEGAEFVVVPGAGHMAPMEQPEAVNSALTRFLARLAS